MVHIWSLLQLVHHISLLAQYHIGGFLSWITAGATAQERHGILAAIASAACRQERSHYCSTLAACGCTECTRALRWLDDGEQVPIITLCKAMEVQTRFAQDHSANLTPTFFRQCILLHTTMPPHTPSTPLPPTICFVQFLPPFRLLQMAVLISMKYTNVCRVVWLWIAKTATCIHNKY